MKQKHHKKYVKHFGKGKFVLPKQSLPDTPDMESMVDNDNQKECNAFLITMRSNRWVHIENYMNIADYKKEQIKIVGKQGKILMINGKDLSVVYFTEDDILIKGRIMSVKYY